MGLFKKKKPKYDNVWDEFTEGGTLSPAPSAQTLKQFTPEQREELKRQLRPGMSKRMDPKTKKQIERSEKLQKAREKEAKKQAKKKSDGKGKKSWW